MEYLQVLDNKQIASLFHIREGEMRIGQTAMSGEDFMEAVKSKKNLPKYVIFGIPEDIGPKANRGRGGAAHMWDWFLKSIILVQDNEFLRGENICLLGSVQTSDLMAATPEKFQSNTDYERAYLLIQALDMRVAGIAAELFKLNCIPVVIGGGHNNSYGIIKGFKTAFNDNLNVINLDPHSDLRDTGTTHSGNSFSRALDEQMLDIYVNIGLHESYNNNHNLDRFQKDKRTSYYSHDAMLRGEWDMNKILEEVRLRLKLKPVGLELDLDGIEEFPSSAQTPSAFSANEARSWILHLGRDLNVRYFHLPEGAPSLGNAAQAGKLLAYLATDFIKANLKKA